MKTYGTKLGIIRIPDAEEKVIITDTILYNKSPVIFTEKLLLCLMNSDVFYS